MISRVSWAASDGVWPTLTPAASRASFLAWAVPDEPDHPVAQIATTLGLSVNTVKTHLQRGLDALGTTLEADR